MNNKITSLTTLLVWLIVVQDCHLDEQLTDDDEPNRRRRSLCDNLVSDANDNNGTSDIITSRSIEPRLVAVVASRRDDDPLNGTRQQRRQAEAINGIFRIRHLSLLDENHHWLLTT